ncbi:MAG: beta-propeller domain-containing protein, partial [Actinomycetes bacterium]
MSTATSSPDDRRRRRLLARVGAAVAAATAGALVVPALTGTEPEAAAAQLVPFTGCGEVEQWYRDQALEQVGPWGLQGPEGGGSWLSRVFGGQGGVDEQSVAGMAEGAAERSDAATGGAVGPGETGTNVQEEGVDEPDLVKTDGRRVVTLSGNTLHVVDTDGGRLRDAGSVTLAGQWLSELLLLGDRALVVGQREPEPVEPEPLPEPGLPEPSEDGGPDTSRPSPLPPESWAPTTVLSVVDLAGGGGPRVVRAEEVEASYLSARVVGDAVRVVLGSTPVIPFPQPLYDSDGSVDEDAAEDANRAVVESMTAADWLPQRVVRDADGSVTSREPAVDCASLAHPVEPAGLGTVIVLTLDAGAADVPTVDTDAVSADGGMVYASADRLYVATTRGGWGFPMPVDVRIGDTVVSTSTQL